MIHGTVRLEDGSPVLEGTITCAVVNGSHGAASNVVGIADGIFGSKSLGRAEPQGSKFVRIRPHGEFTVRLGSINDYEIAEISTVVHRPGADHPEVEVFVPVKRHLLRADGDNNVVVRRRE